MRALDELLVQVRLNWRTMLARAAAARTAQGVLAVWVGMQHVRRRALSVHGALDFCLPQPFESGLDVLQVLRRLESGQQAELMPSDSLQAKEKHMIAWSSTKWASLQQEDRQDLLRSQCWKTEPVTCSEVGSPAAERVRVRQSRELHMERQGEQAPCV